MLLPRAHSVIKEGVMPCYLNCTSTGLDPLIMCDAVCNDLYRGISNNEKLPDVHGKVVFLRVVQSKKIQKADNI